MAARVAVVTGSNQGIGFGIVRRLLKEQPSWTVYLTARTEEKGKEAVKELEKEGLKPQFHQLDICDVSSIQRLRKYLEEKYGGLDVLVNNAGIAYQNDSPVPYAEQTEVTCKTNVFGTMDIMKEMAPILNEGARVVILSSMIMPGCIKKLGPAVKAQVQKKPPATLEEISDIFNKFISSSKDGTLAANGFPERSAYSMSKVGDSMIAMAYQELFNKDSRKDMVVNSCCPGYVNTSLTANRGKKTIDEGAENPSFLAQLPAGTNMKGTFFPTKGNPADWYSY